MSDAAPTQPEAQPSRSGRLLALVRKLIDYGRELAAALQQPDGATDLLPILRSFGTADVARILARIMSGLHRAQALEDRIIQSAARLDANPQPRATPTSQPHTAPSASQPTQQAEPAVAPSARWSRSPPRRCAVSPSAPSSPTFAAIWASSRIILFGGSYNTRSTLSAETTPAW